MNTIELTDSELIERIDTLIQEGYIIESEESDIGYMIFTLTLMAYGEGAMDMDNFVRYEDEDDTMIVDSFDFIIGLKYCIEHHGQGSVDEEFVVFLDSHPFFTQN
jgi:hypothetical protein